MFRAAGGVRQRPNVQSEDSRPSEDPANAECRQLQKFPVRSSPGIRSRRRLGPPQAGTLGELYSGPHADADNHKVTVLLRLSAWIVLPPSLTPRLFAGNSRSNTPG